MSRLPPELHAAYSEVEDDHRANLSRHGVLLPGQDTQQAVALIYLFQHKGKLVRLESLRDFVRGHWAGSSKDIQPRHLKYAGWNILLSGKSGDTLRDSVSYLDANGNSQSRTKGDTLPNGYLMLVDTSNPSPDYEVKKRRGTINRLNWGKIKASYKNRCAMCKSRGKLEKGHKDPTKALSLTNILPMCSECNNWASKDVILDDSGRVVALASYRFVEKADLEVKIRIFDTLSKDPAVNPGAKRASRVRRK